jgi:hypothetical protein
VAAEIVRKRARGNGGSLRLERLEKRSAPEVAGFLLPQSSRVSLTVLEELLLALDGLGRVVGNGVERAALTSEVG